MVTCPGCGLAQPTTGLDPDTRYNASGECRALMHELSGYTLTHGDPRFIHQHLVDAYGAQHVRQSRSTVGAAFTLTGLYLAVERGFTGRQVQQMHMRMARHSRTWPAFIPPATMGPVTVADVLAASPGEERDGALMRWCTTVWAAWAPDQQRVREMVDVSLS
jgi:hypothetical protein